MNKFYLPKIETRSLDSNGVRQYVIRGYATVPNHVYSYRHEIGNNQVRSFKEFFSERALDNIKRKAKAQNIFVDVGHSVGTSLNVSHALNNIQSKTGIDISKEAEYIQQRIKQTDVPMFKVEDIQIDDKGLFVDIRGNPFYREIDGEHRNYFDAVWKSLENGFIGGMSLNFKATEFSKLNESLTQIDDVDIYGISLVPPANDMATITEVAMRCVENVKGEERCQTKLRMML